LQKLITKLDKNKILLTIFSFLMFVAFDHIIISFPLAMNYMGYKENVIGYFISIFGISIVIWRIILARMTNRLSVFQIALIASLVNCIAPIFYYLVDDLFLLMIVRIFHAISPAGFVFSTQMLLMGTVDQKRMGTAVSLFGMTSSFSLLIAPAVAIELVSMSKGFLYPVIASSLISILALGLFIFLDVKKIRKDMEKSKPTFLKPSNIFNKEISIDKLYPSLLHFLFSFCYIGIISFVSIYAKKTGIEHPGLFFTLLAVSSVICRLYVAKKLNYEMDTKYLKIIWTISAIGAILLIWGQFNWNFYISAVFMGIGFGGVKTILLTVLVRVFPSQKRSSTAQFANAFDLGKVIGSFIAGYIISFTSYQFLFLIMGFLLFIPAIANNYIMGRYKL